MNHRQLVVFLQIAASGSIKKAAETLFISQPAVSKTLKELETELNTLLFDRLNGRIYLNSAGKLFQQQAKKLLADYQDLLQLFQSPVDEIPIRVGASLTFGETLLIPALQKFQETFPQTPLQVSITNAKTVWEKLWDNELDVGLLAGPITQPEFINIPLQPLKLVFVGQPKFFQQETITLSAVAQLPLLLRESGSSFRDNLEQAFLKGGLPLTPLWTSASTETLLQGAAAGFGVTLVPETKEIPAGLCSVAPADFSLAHPNYLVYLKSKSQRPAIQALVATLREIAG